MDDKAAAQRINAARRATKARIAALTAEQEAIRSASIDAVGDDEHDPEGATIAFERARVAALLSESVAHLCALDEARGRLATGAFTVCASCGGEIPPERLATLPATTTCIACANAAPASPVLAPLRRSAASR